MCALRLSADRRELEVRGTPLFPCSAYLDEVGVGFPADVPWHWHPEIEAVTVAGGAAEVCIGGERRRVPAGGGFFCNRNVLHSLTALGEPPCTLHSLVFDPAIVAGAPESVFSRHYVRPLLESRTLAGLFLDPEVDWHRAAMGHIEGVYGAMEAEQPGYEFAVRTHLSALWLTILEHSREPLPDPIPYTRETERVKQMISYIRDNLARRLTVGDIAAQASICVRECQRCFEKTLHQSPTAYVLHARLTKAAELLVSTALPVTDIAMETGFSSPSYFSKLFRERFGVSPSDYRAERAGEGPRQSAT